MDSWRALVATVPGALLTVARDTTGGLASTADFARRKFITIAQAMRLIRTGAAPPGEQDRLLGAMTGPAPSADLADAIKELDRLTALHLSAGFAYGLYVWRLVLHGRGGHDPADPLLLRTWWGHCRDALFLVWDVKLKLRSAAAIAQAAVDEMMEQPLTPHDPRASRVGLRFHNAAVGTALALNALRRLRDAVVLEFCVASRVLNG